MEKNTVTGRLDEVSDRIVENYNKILSKREEEKNKNNWIFNKLYNVEYELGNGKIVTFSNVLDDINRDYLIFLSKEYGLHIIKRERILTLHCIDK